MSRDNTLIRDVEYSTDFFKSSPLAFNQDIEWKFMKMIDKFIKQILCKSIKKCENDGNKEESVKKSLDNLKQVLIKEMHTPIQNCGKKMTQTLRIPAHVLLPHHEEYRDYSNCTSNDLELIDQEIKHQQNVYKMTNLLILKAEQKLEMLKQIKKSGEDLSECRAVIEKLNEFTKDILDVKSK